MNIFINFLVLMITSRLEGVPLFNDRLYYMALKNALSKYEPINQLEYE